MFNKIFYRSLSVCWCMDTDNKRLFGHLAVIQDKGKEFFLSRTIIHVALCAFCCFFLLFRFLTIICSSLCTTQSISCSNEYLYAPIEKYAMLRTAFRARDQLVCQIVKRANVENKPFLSQT